MSKLRRVIVSLGRLFLSLLFGHSPSFTLLGVESSLPVHFHSAFAFAVHCHLKAENLRMGFYSLPDCCFHHFCSLVSCLELSVGSLENSPVLLWRIGRSWPAIFLFRSSLTCYSPVCLLSTELLSSLDPNLRTGYPSCASRSTNKPFLSNPNGNSSSPVAHLPLINSIHSVNKSLKPFIGCLSLLLGSGNCKVVTVILLKFQVMKLV